MTVKIENLKFCVNEFTEELQRTHLSYRMDEPAAKQRAKQIIDDIVLNGLENTTVFRFSKIEERKKTPFKQLCKSFETITLNLFGGKLYWVLN